MNEIDEIDQIIQIINKWPNHYPTKLQKNANLIEYIEKKSFEMNGKVEFSLKEKTISILFNQPIVCVNGQKQKIKSIKSGFGFCGSNRTCVCAKKSQKEKIKTFWKNLSHDQKNDILKSRQKTNLTKYGVANPSKNQLIKNKIKNTTIARYGVNNVAKLDEIKNKIKHTNEQKYGVSCNLQSSQTKEKIKQTLKTKYGVEHSSQIKIPREAIDKTKDVTWLKTQHHVYKKPIKQIASELHINHSGLCKKFKKHNLDILNFSTSFYENQVKNFIKQNIPNLEFVCNSRQIIRPYELDVFVPSLNLAIEYCGLYWHSSLSGQTDQWYHFNKFKKCFEKGITLLTVFSDEWINNQKLVQDIIKSFLSNDTLFDIRNFKENFLIESISNLQTLHLNFINENCLNFQTQINQDYFQITCKDQLFGLMGYTKHVHHIKINSLASIQNNFEIKRILIDFLIKKLHNQYNEFTIELDLRYPEIFKFQNSMNFIIKQFVDPKSYQIENDSIRHKFEKPLKSNKFGIVYDCGSVELVFKTTK